MKTPIDNHKFILNQNQIVIIYFKVLLADIMKASFKQVTLCIHHTLTTSCMVSAPIILLLVSLLFIIRGAGPFFILQTAVSSLIIVHVVSLALKVSRVSISTFISIFISIFPAGPQHFSETYSSSGELIGYYQKIPPPELWASQNVVKGNVVVTLISITTFINPFGIEFFVLCRCWI